MKTALVTGASRGVGKGIAIALADAGWNVFATGRSILAADLPPAIHRLACDHLSDEQTAAVFQRIAAESAPLDLLVQSAWGGYERMLENGKFTWGAPFWEQPLHRWQSMIDTGVRAAFIVAGHAARQMLPQRRGLIVNISFWPAQKYIGNLIYGVSKAAIDKMSHDMAHELKPHNIFAVSLYPGLVRTESVLAAASQGFLKLTNSESPEFIGRVIHGLAGDPLLASRSGKVLVAAQVARELGITDTDGASPVPHTLATV